MLPPPIQARTEKPLLSLLWSAKPRSRRPTPAPKLFFRLGWRATSLLQDPLLGHGNVVTRGVLDHVHHLVGLADDLVRALGVFGIRRQPHAAADIEVQSVFGQKY